MTKSIAVAVASKAEQRTARAALSALQSAKAAVVLTQLEKGFYDRDASFLEYSVGAGIAVCERRMRASILPLIQWAFETSGHANAQMYVRHGRFYLRRSNPRMAASGVTLSFDVTNPEAVAWVRQSSGDLIRGVTAETRLAIRQTILQSFEQGIAVEQSARTLRSILGLTSNQAEAVRNFREAMTTLPSTERGLKVWAGNHFYRVPKGGLPVELIQQRVDKYASQLLRQRALNIARTETLRASNEGQRQLWLQARDQGLLSKQANREWIIQDDERLCDLCPEYEGWVVPLDQDFPEGGPPLHPMCRCTIGLTNRTPTEGDAAASAADVDAALGDPNLFSPFALPPELDTTLLHDPKAAARMATRLDILIGKINQAHDVPFYVRQVELPWAKQHGKKWLPYFGTADGRRAVACVRTALEATMRAVEDMRACGVQLGHKQFRVAFSKFGANSYASASGAVSRVNVNLSSPIWASRAALERALLRDAAQGWHPSNASFAQVMTHEVGHCLNYRAAYAGIGTTGYSGGYWEAANWESVGMGSFERGVARQVSRYASTQPVEFIAETFAGMVEGNTYSSEVMNLYRRMGGPTVPRPGAGALLRQGIPAVPEPVTPPAVPIRAPVVVPEPPPVVIPPTPVPTPTPVPGPWKPRVPIPSGDAGTAIQRVLDLRAAGKSAPQIAREVGWYPPRVYRIFSKYGDPLGGA